MNKDFGREMLTCERFVDIMEEYDNLSDQYGETFKMWVGPRLFVTTHNPDDCEIVLNSPETMDKTDQYVHLAEAGANGLVTLNCELFVK